MLTLQYFKIPVSKEILETKDHRDYVGSLFQNENDVLNICNTEEDVQKSNRWFKNLPINVAVASNSAIEPGNKVLLLCVNRELNEKIMTYLGPTDGYGLIKLVDEDGKEHISTVHLLESSKKFERWVTDEEKKMIVNGNLSLV